MKKLIIALAIIALAAPAMADVDLYGSARMWTYVDDKTGAETAPGSETSDDTDTLWALGPFSRFGATFKSGDVGGKVEMDWRDFGSGGTFTGSASSLGDARIRHIYGTWNFGSGEMLVGQTWPITDLPVAGLQRSGGGLQPYGGLGADIARVPQIRFTFGGLAIGFLTPWIQNSPDDPSSTIGVLQDTDTTLPKIEASYRLPLGDHQLAFAGGYQSYDQTYLAAGSETEYSVDSWLAALRGKFNFGAFYLNAIVKYCVNPGPYGAWQGTGISGNPGFDGSSLQDYTLYGGALALGFKINDMLTIEGGYGMNKGEWDISGGTFEQDNSAYYVNLPITLAPGVKIVPEFVKFDYGKTEVGSFQPELEDGEMTSIGAVWYISF
jgi:hypothetical protein